MGARVTDGQIVVDLTNVNLTPQQHQALINAVRAAVVSYLASITEGASIVAVSLLPNNNGDG